MSKPIVFLRIAQFEFDDAADWYEVRRSGRGGKFIAAIRAVLEKIAEQPDFHAEVCSNVRESPLLKFPYCIYYREEHPIHDAHSLDYCVLS